MTYGKRKILLFFSFVSIFLFPEPESLGTAHERYSRKLQRDERLAGNPDASEWLIRSAASLNHPKPLPLPERFEIQAEIAAQSFEFNVKRGEKIDIRLADLPFESGLVFVDLFRRSHSGQFSHVAEIGSHDTRIRHEPDEEGDYVLRIQTELGRPARFLAEVKNTPALRFPVLGKDGSAIRSFWGASRDGGRRSHQGVDIFARRGTPVVASTSGRVTRVQETRIGGKVVWVTDFGRGQSLYYAHLDTQSVSIGQKVRPGDVLGTVGKTGNAAKTPPHLHFGIYRWRQGAIDPVAFIASREFWPRPAERSLASQADQSTSKTSRL